MSLVRDQDPTVAGDISEREIHAQLDRILQSAMFKNSERLQRFLKFAVECALDGTTDQLKESVLGRVVFNRGSEFDPRTDSIVRVEAQRLRRRLQEYYESDGRDDPVAIKFQPGSYVPIFAHASELQVRGGKRDTRPLNPQTVAVLPLQNQSADPEQDYFCEGITDDIIYALSRIPGLNVIGHTSVFAFKGVAQDARDVGAKLGAGTVVDGTVRKSGNRLKIFTEMINAMTGEVRWAQTYERPMDDVFVVEAEIAEAIARVLQMTLAPPVSRGLVRSAPNMDAYLLYLRGRHEWNRMSADGYRTAAEILERATSLYPSYASAYVGLADAYGRLALWGLARPREVFPKALRSAQHALRLDPSLPHAYSSLAVATAFYERRWEEGLAHARTAIELEPSYSFGHHVYGKCLLARAKMDEAHECFERAVDLDPLSVLAHRTLGWMLYLTRRFAQAEQWLQAALVLDREPAETHYLLAHIYLSQRHFAAALEQAELCETDPPDPLGLSVLGACLAHLDRREEALKIVTTLSRLAETRYVESRAIAHLHIALGNIDQAIESVAKSLDEREPFSAFLKLDPAFDPLRGDPRFGELVSRWGL
ncbi:MAG TPA: tetratricopeptide repeat protein [Bryobacteraceae bacterium]|nr:tetratricopeptide repeat protein [Bryobacteraceae bacterium]